MLPMFSRPWCLALILLLLAGPTRAQDCEMTPSPDQIRFEQETRQPRMAAAGKKALVYNLPWLLPLKIHIVRDSTGSGGISDTDLETALQTLADFYDPVGLQFYQVGGINYIDDDSYFNSLDGDAEMDPLRTDNNVSDVINMYFVPDVRGNGGGSICGKSSFTNDSVQGIIIDNGCATNASTVPHEVGHYFDLYHTHETAFGVECPDGSNCDTAGDLACDTGADPNVSGDTDPATCTWTSSAVVPGGCSGSYDPPVDNMMSYADKDCRLDITADQEDRIFDALLNERPELLLRVVYVDVASTQLFSLGLAYYPFTSLGAALTAAENADYVAVAPGTYSEGLTLTTPGKFRRWDLRAGSVLVD